MKVLLIEDDKEISKVLESFLTDKGYQVQCAYDGREASLYMKQKQYQIVLMDLMLPYKSGDQLIKELREYSSVPVIVLSAKSMMDTRLEMLRIGADDYILKPFNLDEVLVRMEVVLRRSVISEEDASKKQETSDVISLYGLTYNSANQNVNYNGKEIRLTSKELQLLAMFLENPKKTFSKANLYETVWNDVYYYEDNTINVHMSNLRSKLKKATGQDFIETVWGIGYRVKEQ